MKTVGRVLLTLVFVAAGCAGGYELWDYYLFSPWTRDARVQADVVSIAPDVSEGRSRGGGVQRVHWRLRLVGASACRPIGSPTLPIISC
jgi:hypothetical protein